MPDAKQKPRKVVKVVKSGRPEIYPDVQIHDSTLEKLSEFHPEEFSRIDDVYKTIESPDSVYRSRTKPENHVTLLNQQCTTDGGDPLRVVVKLVTDGSALMASAYFTGTTNQGEKLWPTNGDKTD